MTSNAASDDPNTAFPASEKAPGQKESREARERFLKENSEKCTWLRDYLELRLEGWDWRKAAYIAWASSPMNGRWPDTQQELAVQVLGLKSDRTIRTWREKDSTIDERVARLQIEPLMQHRRDVIDALIDAARSRDPKAFQDRRTFFTLTGDLQKKGESSKIAPNQIKQDAAPEFSNLSEEELGQVISNLESALEQENPEDYDDSDDDEGE